MSEDKTVSRQPRVLFMTLLAALCGMTIAAGCPNEKSPRNLPPSVTDAGVQGAVSEAPKKGEGITQSEPPPGSLEVKDVGPPAPTLFFMAGMKGYTEPCGCTLDILLGGVDRIAGYLTEARKLARGSILVDAGDMLFDQSALESHRVAQEQAKVDVIIEAHLAMGTVSTTPGPNDFALGKHFYLDKVRGAGIEILAANLSESEGLPLGVPHTLHDLDGLKVGLIGLVQPDLFVGIEGLKVTDPAEAARASIKALKKEGARVLVAVHHGDLKASKLLLEAVPELNFVIVGHKPRETDQVDQVGGAFTLEAYDQGRYLGALKLYAKEGVSTATFLNGRKVSKADVERVERRIEQVESQIERLPPATPGNEPPMLKTLRTQLDGLKEERGNLSNANIDLPPDSAAFIYRSVAIRPGYPLSADLTRSREAFNEKLKDLVPDEKVTPVAEGEAEYVGSERCAGCHPLPTKVWEATKHAKAIDTLISRNKSFDGNCIACHVTGYRKPGGSVLGTLQYTATVSGQAFTKKLENVGCEVCHGPGSKHMAIPVDANDKPLNIAREVPEKVCAQCHNSEHSPRFKYPVYLEEVLGEGHSRR